MQAKTKLFLLAHAILYTYVCGMKKISQMQIKSLFIFILDKLSGIIPNKVWGQGIPHHIKHNAKNRIHNKNTGN